MHYFYNCLNITFFTSSVSSFYWLFYKFLPGIKNKGRAVLRFNVLYGGRMRRMQ